MRFAGLRAPFYGWAIVAVCSLVAFSSGPGQSFGFSVFIDSIIEDTGLDRTLISTLYAVGTGVSAVMVMIVSRLADRFGARQTLILAGVFLGFACWAMALAHGPIAFFLAFAALRALGQGSLTINATLLTAQWFVRQRGRAMAIMGLGFPAAVAILPPACRLLIDEIRWRETYALLGVMVWVLVLPGAIFIVRDTPEKMGFFPDGADGPPPGETANTAAELGPDRRRVFTSATFWLLAIPLSTSSLISTGLIFHQTAILGERGVDATVAATVFVPYAVTSALVSVVAGFLIDRMGPKRMFIFDMGLLLASMATLFAVTSPATAVAYGVVLGAAGGVTRIISGITWAHYYGRHRLGRIQGSGVMVNITSSALGPVLYAALYDAFGGWGPGIAITAVYPVLSVFMISLARPQSTSVATDADDRAAAVSGA